MLHVRDVMSRRLLTLRDNASIGRGEAEMKLAKIRHFPVVDGRGRLVGVVSNRDILRAIGDSPIGKAHAVSEIMSRTVYTARPEDPAQGAAKRMRELKIGSLPVVKEDGSLVGIITETDFLQVAERALAGEPLGKERPAWEHNLGTIRG